MNEQISKTFANSSLSALTADNEMTLINTFTLKELAPEQVFLFKLVLCDNEIDRDIERFSDTALEHLAKLFYGKTVIADHDPKASNQAARIYFAEVEATGNLNSLGKACKRLVAKCYMVKTVTNADFITEIEAGIKKEVSVGVRCNPLICSICGLTQCTHKKGMEYGGVKCHKIMDAVSDAYEVSFVAIPAQRQAGVTKQFSDMQEEQSNFSISMQLEIEKYKTHILFNN